MNRPVVVIIIILVIVIVAGVVLIVNVGNNSSQTVSLQTYASQIECESATGKECSFSVCDYVPEGKTFEEVCGGIGKQWLPSSNKLNYKVIKWEDVQSFLGASEPYCAITYFDTVSFHIGQTMSADEAVEVWSANVEKLEPLYRKYSEAENLRRMLMYNNFLWSNTPDNLEIRYRKKEHGYEHEGWYFATMKGKLLGEFFLSNEGYLMPAIQTCSRVECCL